MQRRYSAYLSALYTKPIDHSIQPMSCWRHFLKYRVQWIASSWNYLLFWYATLIQSSMVDYSACALSYQFHVTRMCHWARCPRRYLNLTGPSCTNYWYSDQTYLCSKVCMLYVQSTCLLQMKYSLWKKIGHLRREGSLDSVLYYIRESFDVFQRNWVCG